MSWGDVGPTSNRLFSRCTWCDGPDCPGTRRSDDCPERAAISAREVEIEASACDTCGGEVTHGPLLLAARDWSALLCRACHNAYAEQRLQLLNQRPDVHRLAIEVFGLPEDVAASLVA